MEIDGLPETQIEAVRYFSDLNNCHSFMVKMRWSEGVKCAHCQSDNIGKFSKSRRVWNCKSCKKQFSVKVGTIFENSPLGLDKWLPAVWMLINAKNGVSSCEIARVLGVTQKTAWFMGHRVRLALQVGSFEKMSGVVESDETFIGGKARNMHWGKRKVRGTGPVGKTIVQGILQRGEDGTSKAITKVIPNTKRHTIQGTIKEHVAKGSQVMTDALLSYQGLEGDYKHGSIDHAVCYVRGNIHTNGLENFWSLLKRGIKGTYISIKPIHMFRYLDEQTYRFNERTLTDGQRFLGAVPGFMGRRLTYRDLINKPAAIN